MCMMNNQPVDEYASPCGSCPDYLSTCSPVVCEGYIAGAECDFCACEFCYYTDCPDRCA